MIDGLIRWCLRNTFLVLIGVAAIVVGGYCDSFISWRRKSAR